ncbi:hypothetical protein [Anaerophilus nitritogenes]|uniref:hypothetical protein n=1 Tax=Anaerophilus nitritogenes TaxID=2498136 RepID=UPI00101D6773|nr:hypothetical protein [Anaerophilus nitritogenes]
MRTLYRYETGHKIINDEECCYPHLTFDINEARQWMNFRIANMHDLDASSGAYEIDEMFEGLFQIWDEETEMPKIVKYCEDYRWDEDYSTYELVDGWFREATPGEIQSLSCDVCMIREECENRVKIA